MLGTKILIPPRRDCLVLVPSQAHACDLVRGLAIER